MADPSGSEPKPRIVLAGITQGARAASALLGIATGAFLGIAFADQEIDRHSTFLLFATIPVLLIGALVTSLVRRHAKLVLIAAALVYSTVIVGVLLLQLNDGERPLYVRIGIATLLLAGVSLLLWTCLLPQPGKQRRRYDFTNYYDN